jgi:Fuc2NAc and GlcNAc transferase
VADTGVVYGLGLAAVAGFLVWNWPPAKVFMGDAGSLMLGFWLSAPLWLAGWEQLGVWLIVTAAFNVDASLTLLARWQRGDALAQAHRSHLYQRLARHWGGHRPVLWALMLVNGFWLLPWAWVAHTQADWIWASVVVAYGGLGLFWWRFRGLEAA